MEIKSITSQLTLAAVISTAALAEKGQEAVMAPLPVDTMMSEFYTKELIPMPEGEVIEVGSIALMPNKRLAIGTRRGDIWLVDGAYADDLSKVKWTLFFRGAHEPFGMFYRDGWLQFSDRGEIAKIRDTNGDDKADQFRVVNASWEINGDYHEYNFGSEPDKDGNMWTLLCLTGSKSAPSKFRGWAMRITPEGEAIPTCSGVRSPGGIGFNAKGDLFYSDNQGFWNGSSCIKHLKPGGFMGNPTGNVHYELTDAIGPRPTEPNEDSRIQTERARIPELVPPAVIFPHVIVGRSPTGILPDLTEGKFGPFAEQTFVAEQNGAEVQRVYLEEVNGVYQGAVWKFLNDFATGIVPIRLSDDGTLFCGGTNRGWGGAGKVPFSLERVRWNGNTPTAMKEMKVTPDGFDITFTKPIDSAAASQLENYHMHSWTYIYRSGYGSPEVDPTDQTITDVKVASDGLSVSLKVDNRQLGHVHHLELKNIKGNDGATLWHPNVFYTLNEIPSK